MGFTVTIRLRLQLNPKRSVRVHPNTGVSPSAYVVVVTELGADDSVHNFTARVSHFEHQESGFRLSQSVNTHLPVPSVRFVVSLATLA
jgi:hypothetical protein